MAIDLICYTNVDVVAVQRKLDQLRFDYHRIFSHSYVLYNAHKIYSSKALEHIKDLVERYALEGHLLNAEESGIKNPCAYFLISVNDKSFSEATPTELAELIRSVLGKDNVVILPGGEEPI